MKSPRAYSSHNEHAALRAVEGPCCLRATPAARSSHRHRSHATDVPRAGSSDFVYLQRVGNDSSTCEFTNEGAGSAFGAGLGLMGLFFNVSAAEGLVPLPTDSLDPVVVDDDWQWAAGPRTTALQSFASVGADNDAGSQFSPWAECQTFCEDPFNQVPRTSAAPHTRPAAQSLRARSSAVPRLHPACFVRLRHRTPMIIAVARACKSRLTPTGCRRRPVARLHSGSYRMYGRRQATGDRGGMAGGALSRCEDGCGRSRWPPAGAPQDVHVRSLHERER